MIAPTHLARQAPSPRQLERAYPMPREALTLSEWLRARHLDLPGLSALDLDREHFRVAHRLAFESDPCHQAWLVARRQAIEAERRRRAGARR